MTATGPGARAWIRLAVADTVPDLAPAGLRERLAGRPAGQQFHVSSRYQLGDLGHAVRVTQVPVQRKPAKVMPVRLDRLGSWSAERTTR